MLRPHYITYSEHMFCACGLVTTLEQTDEIVQVFSQLLSLVIGFGSSRKDTLSDLLPLGQVNCSLLQPLLNVLGDLLVVVRDLNVVLDLRVVTCL